MAYNSVSVNLFWAYQMGIYCPNQSERLTAIGNVSKPGSSRVNNVNDSRLKIDRNGEVHKKIKPICSHRCQTYVSDQELGLKNRDRDSGADIWRVLVWIMEVKTSRCSQTQDRSARQMGNLGFGERRFPSLPGTTGAGV